MTILVEEVHSLLSVSQPGVPWLDADIPLPYREADMETLIARVFTAPPTYPVLNGRWLNLAYLYHSFLRTQDFAFEEQLRIC